ncbi:addiction module antidote protein [Desulfovibrio fairfieldensis]|uniref:Addiction module antitoxin n=1 Tax=Desulfovibrio fairfieldensis TaxID=44742 RepID=A0A0X8JHC1_9BACT|nr:addiction module antidote protein [Desulfovibrio fairfieldensis]AMD88840.1 addiction module antitoxin [Desulfovibrio fairfieldensis]DAX01791.1 MAG TPA: putative addiction module antidote protein [Bacteriophage sp.]
MKYSKFDVVDYLDSEESIAEYLSAVMEERDPDLVIAALSDIAKARGMAKLAEDSGLNRESLYKALRPGSKPRYETIAKIMGALNVKLQAVPIKQQQQSGTLL